MNKLAKTFFQMGALLSKRFIIVSAITLICITIAGCGSDSNSPPQNSYAIWTTVQMNMLEDLTASGFPPPAALALNNQTLRQIVHISQGGNSIKIKLSNIYGANPVTFSGVKVAKCTDNSGGPDIIPSSNSVVTFNGITSVTLPPGKTIWSDPINLTVSPETNLAITSYFSSPTTIATYHMFSYQTN